MAREAGQTKENDSLTFQHVMARRMDRSAVERWRDEAQGWGTAASLEITAILDAELRWRDLTEGLARS